MLQNGVDPDVGDYDKRTAMHLACAQGHQKVSSLNALPYEPTTYLHPTSYILHPTFCNILH